MTSKNDHESVEPREEAISPSSQLHDYIELFVLAMTALFVELLVIRWMSADVRAFIVFRTFPLVACFVGFGTGFAWGKDALFKFSPIALLAFVSSMKIAEISGVDFWQFPGASVFQWQNLVTGNNSLSFLFQFIIVLTLLLAGPFFLCMFIASRMGVLFNRLTALKAYAVGLLYRKFAICIALLS